MKFLLRGMMEGTLDSGQAWSEQILRDFKGDVRDTVIDDVRQFIKKLVAKYSEDETFKISVKLCRIIEIWEAHGETPSVSSMDAEVLLPKLVERRIYAKWCSQAPLSS